MRPARRALVVGCVMVLAFGAVAEAQESPIIAIIGRARNALNDLRYAQADSLARAVLLLGDMIPTTQRVTALQIAAAARYPEEVQFQRVDSAMSALKELVRLGQTSAIPAEFSWPGLDTLFVRAGGMLPSAGATQSGTSGVPLLTASGMGPTREETSQWLMERLPQFTGIVWKDSGAVAIQSQTESVASVEFRGCVMKYKLVRREEMFLPKERSNRRRQLNNDSTVTQDLRTLDPATFEIANSDVEARLGRLPPPGTTATKIVTLKVFDRAAKKGDPHGKRVDMAFLRNDQARRVRGAIEHLIQLCQREPF